MKKIREETGYPSKKYIKYLLGTYNARLLKEGKSIKVPCVTFSSMYAEDKKRTGILWKNKESMKDMDGFMDILTERGIVVKRYKKFGKVHSVWFSCQLTEK